MTNSPMDLTEAKRRFEKKLVLRGYSMSGNWWTRVNESKKWETHWMSLRDLPDTRAVMWAEGKDKWIAMISVTVGQEGEFPITGGTITRFNSDSWQLGSFKSLVKRIDEVRTQVRRWDYSAINDLGNVAMMQLALDYLRGGKPKKCISSLLLAIRGEISQATISEALSIVQSRVAKSREDRLHSALVWSQVFK